MNRNDVCHCGSGRKYKRCHQAVDATEESKKKRELLLVKEASRAAHVVVSNQTNGRFCIQAFLTWIPLAPAKELCGPKSEPLILSDESSAPIKGPEMPESPAQIYFTIETTMVVYAHAESVEKACALIDQYADHFNDDKVCVWPIGVWSYHNDTYSLIEEPYKNCFMIHDRDERYAESVN